MQQPTEKQPKRRKGNGWVLAATGLLTAFTVFVLLDTFAIERVQMQAQAADLSSIVAAQEKSTASSEAASDASESAGASDARATSEGSNGDENASQDANGDKATSQGASESSTSEAQSSSGTSAKSGPSATKRGHGPGGKHKAPGSSSSSSGSSSGSSGSSGSSSEGSSTHSGTSKGSRSASKSQTTEAVAVAGAGAADTAGESLGSYSDDNMQIQVSKVRAYDTDIYIADVQVTSAEYLKTAFAQNAFGRNLKDTTSNMADAANAVLAINGDYYGFRDDGYVVRNGVLYRDTTSAGTDALVIYGDGSMASVSQDDATAQQLVDSGAWQVLSFGPTLVSDGAVVVSGTDEVGQSKNSNPRTAIGMVSPLHYVVVVSDGRTGDNAGLSLNQLAQVLVDNGATYAYNLDGGGSTTLYFKGEVLNSPSSGNRSGEREVSDIVYFG